MFLKASIRSLRERKFIIQYIFFPMRGQWKPTQLIQIELEANRAGNKASFLGQ